jgi:hypothetical protein
LYRIFRSPLSLLDESKGEAMNEDEKPPFPRHRTYYVVLKYAVMLLGVLLAIYVFGLLWR